MIEKLHLYFELNKLIVLAVYAQVYFTLALVVLLQWRQESGLELARSVPYLSAFALAMALVIWGDIFIPFQEVYLPQSAVRFLRAVQAGLLVIGFCSLLYFGIQLNWNTHWVCRVPLVLAVGGLTFVVITTMSGMDPALQRMRVEQFGRLFVVYPGSFTAAWGLRGQAEKIEALGLPSYIVDWLRVAGFSFGAFAIVGGILIPLTPTGTTVLENVLGMPAAIPRSVVMAVLAFAMLRALSIFRYELQRLIAEMGRAQALAADRQRIGRELHDGTIQAIYGAGLMLQHTLHLIGEDPEKAEANIRAIMNSLNQTIADIRRYIYDLASGEGELEERLSQLTAEMRSQTGMTIDYRIEGKPPRLPATVQEHIFQIVREALTNAHKHSGGDHVTVLLRSDADALRIVVSDNGRGLPPGGPLRPGGQGVPNILSRVQLLGGRASIRNGTGGGTVVEVEVPYLNTSIWQPSTPPSGNNGDRQGASHETPAHPSR